MTDTNKKLLTICCNCQHHHEDKDPETIKHLNKDGNYSWLWQCYHPDSRRKKGVYLDSGKPCFIAYESDGDEYRTSEEYPDCDEVNKGNCQLFEEKSNA